ncbi:MAG: hypothetical protein K8R02_09270 [Anaerohalosphaeraceae bacterium]|nr:hypothetical protein [Anaerohalosphaeraceae bacterium]
MTMRRNVLFRLSVFFLSITVFGGIATALGAITASLETQVFVETDAIGGIAETASQIGSVCSLADMPGSKDVNNSIIAARLNNKYIIPLLKSLTKLETQWLGEQGFYIKSLEDGRILITANTQVGLLYGLMELRDRIKDDGREVSKKQKFDVRDRPVFDTRKGDLKKRANFVNFWSPEQQNPDGRDSSLFLYESSPEIFPDEKTRSEHIRKVMVRRERLKNKIAEAKTYGAKVYLFMYQPTLPWWGRDSFIAARPEVKPYRKTEWWHPFICPSQQASKDALYNKIKNLFADVNDIGGILLNIGEHTQSIFSCGCEKCEAQSYEDRLYEYLMLIRKAMHESTPDAVIYLRPWGIFKHGLEADTNKFFALAEKLPKDIRFWSKVTVPPGSDYLWNDHFNPFVNMPRMETFGWDTHHPELNQPCRTQLCYTAPKLKARLEKLAAMGMKGQPTIRVMKAEDDVLYEPSRLASHKISWDPYNFDSYEFLLKWAQKRFGNEAAPYVADALKDTYKLTDAFIILSKNTNWFHMFNFVKDKRTHCYTATNTTAQTNDVLSVNEKTLEQVLSKFKLTEAIKIADNAEAKLTKAMAVCPKNKTLERFWMLGKATAGLTRFYHHYHFALIYNNMSETTERQLSEKYHKLAVEHIKLAVPQMEKYGRWIHKAHPQIGSDYFSRQPSELKTLKPRIYPIFGQVASTRQQCQNAYNRLVMEPFRAKRYPYLLWECENDEYTGYRRYAPFPDNLKWSNVYPRLLKRWKGEEYIVDVNDANGENKLAAVVSPWILPKMRVKFNGDLSDGAMLVLRFVPLGSNTRRLCRKSILKIELDGKNVSTLTDIATGDSMEDNEFVRYIKLPAIENRNSHELTFTSMSDCIGTEFFFARLYTPTEQKLYKLKPHTSLNPFKEKLIPPLWGTKILPHSRTEQRDGGY